MTIDAARTALLVMDFQESILASVSDAPAMLDRVAGAIAAVRAAGGTIAYVRVAFEPAEIDAFPKHSAMGQRMRAAAGAMANASAATAIHPHLAPWPGDIVVRKIRVGAFSTTDLDRQLRDKGVDTLALAGIHTSGVTLSTVRDGHDRDYRLIVLNDGCADPDPVMHDFLIDRLFPKQAEVMRIADFQQSLQTKASAHA